MNYYPLSKTEYGIYVEQITMQNTAYNLPLVIKMADSVDIERLIKAIQAAVNAHPHLKTAFITDENGEIYKYQRDTAADVQIVEMETADFCQFVKPFDLYNDVLFRFFIIKTPEQNYLFYDIHHIIFDGTSNLVFLTDINRAYDGEELLTEQPDANIAALQMWM